MLFSRSVIPNPGRLPPAHTAVARRDLGAVAGIGVLLAAGYSVYGILRHRNFDSSAYDLGIFDQAVWHLSRFELPASTINNHPNLFGDHFHPVIALWAPLYWMAPGPETLIVAQAVLFGASVIPVFLFARDRLPRRAALALTLAYGLFWGLQRAAAFDVHEIAFAPLVIASAILALDRARWGLFWACMVALVFTKEDLIPLVGGFGLLLWFRGQTRRAVVAIAGSIAAFVVVLGVVIPAANASGGYAYASSFTPLLARPWTIPIALVTPVTKLWTAFLWLAPFLFTSLVSPIAILMLPLVVERFLSASPLHYGTSFHYTAPMAPILAMSAADGLARLGHRLSAARGAGHGRRAVLGACGVIVVLCALLPGRQPLWQVVNPARYRTTPVQIAGREALAAVPPAASVVAQAAIVPHLSQRESIYILDTVVPRAEYIVTAERLSPWPAATFAELTAGLDAVAPGYAVVFERDGWRVLRRGSHY